MNQLEQIKQSNHDDMWSQMESFTMNNSSVQAGTFGTAISLLNQRKNALRAANPSLVQPLTRTQPLEVAELAVDPTEPHIEQTPAIELQDTLPEVEQAPEIESYSYPQQDLAHEDGHQVTNQVEDAPRVIPEASSTTDEPQVDKVLSADELMKHEAHNEDFGAIFRMDKAGQESIASYQAEKSQKHEIAVMEEEFATTFDERRNALPLENDGSLRDFFHNTRNGESIQNFSSDMQNMTTGEIMDFYASSDDPIASHKFNTAMDIGYREMLKTHKEERQALYDNPDSSIEDFEKFEKQVSMEVGMYEHHLLKHEHGLHASYLNKLEKGPQNQEVAMKIQEAREVQFEMPTLENLNNKYQIYRASTPELEIKREEFSKNISNEELSIGQSVPTESKAIKTDLKKDTFEVQAQPLHPALEKANRIKASLTNRPNVQKNKSLSI